MYAFSKCCSSCYGKVQVICWVLGEYGTADGKYSASYIIGKLCDVAEAHSSDDTVQVFILQVVCNLRYFPEWLWSNTKFPALILQCILGWHVCGSCMGFLLFYSFMFVCVHACALVDPVFNILLDELCFFHVNVWACSTFYVQVCVCVLSTSKFTWMIMCVRACARMCVLTLYRSWFKHTV